MMKTLTAAASQAHCEVEAYMIENGRGWVLVYMFIYTHTCKQTFSLSCARCISLRSLLSLFLFLSLPPSHLYLLTLSLPLSLTLSLSSSSLYLSYFLTITNTCTCNTLLIKAYLFYSPSLSPTLSLSLPPSLLPESS